jgi:hypothetical protein
MGTPTGAPLGADGLRGLNQPQAIEVAVDEQDVPRLVRLSAEGFALRVVAISDVWRVDDGWWRLADQQVRRLYFELTLENGAHVTLYHDLVHESWHAQRA